MCNIYAHNSGVGSGGEGGGAGAPHNFSAQFKNVITEHMPLEPTHTETSSYITA